MSGELPFLEFTEFIAGGINAGEYVDFDDRAISEEDNGGENEGGRFEDQFILDLAEAADIAMDDMDEYALLVDEKAMSIMEIGAVPFAKIAPPLTVPYFPPTDLHSTLYPKEYDFRLQAIDGRPVIFPISAKEAVMPYTIKVRVYQTNTNAYFHIVEKGCWHYAKGAEWSEHNGVLTLTMGDSGTSGMLRFKTEQGKEAFFIAMGVHNYKPWVDTVTGLADDVTCVKALPEYYGNASDRTRSRESQRTSQSILNIDRRTIATEYKVSQGNDLELNIIIN
ncbi:hypothetical protein NW759_012731 [Fusarium solani]|nr:hypothetical protein NW759_012731 [Fusarium solani]